MEENKDLTMAAMPTPTDVAQPVVPPMPTETVATETVQNVSAPVPTPAAEPEPEREGNGDTITFDYNQLYDNSQQVSTQGNEANMQEETPVAQQEFQETPIVLETEQPTPTAVVKDIVPTFDTNALENDLPDELKPKVEEPLIHTMATETQKEKQEGRQNILFIVIFFAVLIIAVLVIFPMMLGL